MEEQPLRQPVAPIPPMSAPTVAPTQKEAELGRKTEGQRHINRMWEITQAFLAIVVTCTSLFVTARLAINWHEEETHSEAIVFITGIANLVIGFYFGRTNHQRTGGVGASDNEVR